MSDYHCQECLDKEVCDKTSSRCLELIRERQQKNCGVICLPLLGITTKVYQNRRGKYVILPASKKKFYFEKESCV